jgi:acetoin utilization protein AcuB
MVCKQDIIRVFPPDLNPFSVASVDGLPSLGTVGDIMSKPVITIEADQPIEAAAQRMTEQHIGGLPVVQGEKMVGIITESDIFRVFSKLLSGQTGSARITFDITQSPDALPQLLALCRDLKLDLTSMITFVDGTRRLAVARVSGANQHRLIEKLWDAGHSVLNVT